jgi:hypothetical protein
MRGRWIAFDDGAVMVSDFHAMIRRLTRRDDDEGYAERDTKRRCLTHFVGPPCMVFRRFIMRKRDSSDKAEYILRMRNYDASDEESISEVHRG